MMISRFRIATLVALAALSAATLAGEGQGWRAHYLANAGVMVVRGETKVLFDPFFRNDYGQYDRVPQETEAALFAGSAPYDGIDALFISHHHDDHFDPATVMRYLQRWPEVELYAPAQAVTALLALDEAAPPSLRSRLHSVDLEPDSAAVHLDMDGLQIDAVRIAHAGWPERFADVENIVFRVTLDEAATVMHMGDADAGSAHYAPHTDYWQARKTDVALVPVWLMLTDKGRYVLQEYVDAGHEIGMHVYTSIADDPTERPASFEGLDIFTQPGETRQFNDDNLTDHHPIRP